MIPEDVAQKLKRLRKSLPAGVVSASELARKPPAVPELPDMSRFVPGEVRTGGEGTCFVSEEWFPFDVCFGNAPLDSLRHLDCEGVIQSFGLESSGASGRILFLDTETTGLAGGSGTYAFLVGIGSIEAEGFRVRQFFMRDYDEEPGQMALVAEELRDCALLVTYNGAAFDLPLLRTRFVFNRTRLNLTDIPHLDLLPVARRLWKPRHGGASLSFLENKILGNEREGDIPGSLIPTLYFHFLQGASPRTLVPVFYHNRMDIVALAALTERAHRLHRDPDSIEDHWERLGVARFHCARGRHLQALQVLRPIEEHAPAGREWQLCVRLLSSLHKREGNLERASKLWWRAHAEGEFDPLIRVELAKYLEHSVRDFGKARELVLEIFAHYEVEPDHGETDEVSEEEEEVHYDYSEWSLPKREALPVYRIDGEGDEEDERADSALLPRWTERFARELNHRLRRLERKLRSSGG